MTQTSLSARAWAELLLLALVWGGSFLAIRTALDEIGPLTSVLYRTAPAALILLMVLRWQGAALPKGAALWGRLMVMGLLNNVIPFTLMAWGQLHIESGLTAILNATTAIFGVLIAAMVFADERLTARKALGVSLGFAGVALTIGPGALTGFSVTSLAQIAVLAGTLSYAFAGVWARAQLSGLSPLAAAFGMLTASTAVMLPLTLLVEGVPPVALSASAWTGIAYYAALATALAYLLYYRVLKMAGSGNLLLVTLMIPPIAIVLGAAFRGESLGPAAYAGFALLVMGLAIIDGRVLRRNRV
ncbi:DMT family transporter [Pacificoceanicola onchidii]|uniref:DMT family transporter n=1 Tax=Pacificoceanicola onchidii TaxID=2562685 RepID=UPI0010A67342|nr:DMT family transporter [Pacificoceanicola onchidii]